MISYDWWPYEKRKFDHINRYKGCTCTEEKQRKLSENTIRRDASEETKLDHYHPPEM